MRVDEEWLTARVAATQPELRETAAVICLKELLKQRAAVFAERRPDVESSAIVWPRRGLLDDEAESFLRALDTGLVEVDDAGYVTLPTFRQKTPPGRYALHSKSGSGVSINLEYLIQIGATAELVLDHGWSATDIDFERGEFDAIGVGDDNQTVLVMEAKARVSGPDSLETLLTSWLRFSRDHTLDLNNNAGRKYRDLRKRCEKGSVVVWLVAAGARWSLVAQLGDGSVCLAPGSAPTPEFCRKPWAIQVVRMYEAFPYDASHYQSGTVAAAGRCSWHGRPTCEDTPVVSFQDIYGWWQSGCERALDELIARGEISPPSQPQN